MFEKVKLEKLCDKMLATTLLMLLLQTDLGLSRKPINIYWNSTNPLFTESPEPVNLDVNSDMSSSVRQFDQINLICPSGVRNKETHIIYSVTRDEFESCEVRGESPTIVAICDQPTNFLYFTITFRYFTPSPRQLEFKPGETYYFISTASPGHLAARQGGYCRHNNMRIQFRIGEALEENKIPDEYLTFPPAFWSRYWRSRVPDARDQYANKDNDKNNKQRDYRDLAFSSTQQLPYKSDARSWVTLNLTLPMCLLFVLYILAR
eukprot:TRINITY_DN6743_c0_g1_i3.p1 TRINITY_DN6743_c0_g1~~TRINITY_DN6743_c0_g1_i3.p1  ORF type:complete len:263 (+),score=26.90 TRINITY_DN6743_c0_g1_i3:43-831(+)